MLRSRGMGKGISPSIYCTMAWFNWILWWYTNINVVVLFIDFILFIQHIIDLWFICVVFVVYSKCRDIYIWSHIYIYYIGVIIYLFDITFFILGYNSILISFISTFLIFFEISFYPCNFLLSMLILYVFISFEWVFIFSYSLSIFYLYYMLNYCLQSIVINDLYNNVFQILICYKSTAYK